MLHSLKQGVCAGNMNRRHSFWCPVLAGYGRLQKEWSGVHVLTDEHQMLGQSFWCGVWVHQDSAWTLTSGDSKNVSIFMKGGAPVDEKAWAMHFWHMVHSMALTRYSQHMATRSAGCAGRNAEVQNKLITLTALDRHAQCKRGRAAPWSCPQVSLCRSVHRTVWVDTFSEGVHCRMKGLQEARLRHKASCAAVWSLLRAIPGRMGRSGS